MATCDSSGCRAAPPGTYCICACGGVNHGIDNRNRSTNYDVFISHATEDKAEVALPLTRYLEKFGIRVWLDEFELTIGDSLRKTIDEGLARSRFGIVILSPDFFLKGWTNRELDGLVAREDTEKFILPIWHNVTREDVTDFSPMLAGKLAVSTSRGIEHVASQVIRAIKQGGRNLARHLDALPVEDERTSELSELRKSMLEAHSSWELQALQFRTEEFLTRYPNYPEALMLRERILTAVEREQILKTQQMPVRMYSKTRSSGVFFAVVVIVVLLFFLLRWLLGW